MRRSRALLRTSLLLIVALAACHRERAAGIAYQSVGDDNRELRRAFNADVAFVRVIMLVAPS